MTALDRSLNLTQPQTLALLYQGYGLRLGVARPLEIGRVLF
jgi:hypothetical protein